MSYQLIIERGKITGISKELLSQFQINSLDALLEKSLEIQKILSGVYLNKEIFVFGKKIIVSKASFLTVSDIDIINIEILENEQLSINPFEIDILKTDEINGINHPNNTIKEPDLPKIEIELEDEEKPIEQPVIEKENITKQTNTVEDNKPLIEVDLSVITQPTKIEKKDKSENNAQLTEDGFAKIEETEKTQKIQLTFKNEALKIKEALNIHKDKFFIQKEIQKEIENATKELGLSQETLEKMTKEVFKQVLESKKEFETAIEKQNYDKLHSISHKLKGGALNLRLEKLALALKTIDELSKKRENISIINEIVETIYLYLDKAIQEEKRIITKQNKNNTPKIKLNEKQKKIIQQYLRNATEEKFKEDKVFFRTFLKYPELNSLEELRKMVIS